MLVDEELVKLLYNNVALEVTVQYEATSNHILSANVYFPNGSKETVHPNDIKILIQLKMLIEDYKLRQRTNMGLKKIYRLARVTRVKIDIVKEKGLFRMKNYHYLPFLSLAKQSCIIAHIGQGMVDFEYKEVPYTVKKGTPYSFFENQSKLSSETRRGI